MALYVNRLRSFAAGNPEIALFPTGWGPDKLREYLARCMASLAAGLNDDPGEMWEHQVDAITGISTRVADTTRKASGIVVVPTGGGKTEIFQRIVDAAFRKTKDERMVGPNTFVLVPTLNLVEQTARRFVAKHPRLAGVVGVMGSILPESISGMKGYKPITVTTYEGFVRLVLSGHISPAEVHMLVMDEAHRALSDLRQDVFAPFLENCVTVAFSATPEFDETKSLYDLFGEDAELINVPASKLRADGIIAPVVNYVLAVSISGELPEDRALAARVKRSAIVVAIRDFWRDHLEAGSESLKDKTALGFFRDRSHSAMACEAMNELVPTGEPGFDVVSGYDGPDLQGEKIEALRRGDIRGLFNSRFLGEGSDIPEVGAVLMSPTSSKLQAVQVGGRAVRFDPRYPHDDTRQTAIVVNTVLEINGKIIGSPVSYWKVLEDYGIARFVQARPLEVSEVPLLGELDGWFEEALASSESAEGIEDTEETVPDEIPSTPPELLVEVTNVEIEVEVVPDQPEAIAEEIEDPEPEPEHQETLVERSELYLLRYSIRHRENLVAGKSSVRLQKENPGWIDRYGLLKSFAGSIDEAMAEKVMAEIEKASDADGKETAVGNPPVRMKVVRKNGRPVVLFDTQSVKSIGMRLDVTSEPMDDEWISRMDIFRGKWITPETIARLNEIDELFLERRRLGDVSPIILDKALIMNNRKGQGSVRYVSVPPVSIPIDLRIGGNGKQVCYARSVRDDLRRLIGIAPEVPSKTEGWLTRKEAEAMVGLRSVKTDKVFQAVDTMLVEREAAGVMDDVYLLEGRGVRAKRLSTGKTSKPVCYHMDSIPNIKVLADVKRSQDKSPEDLSYKELAKALRTHPFMNMDLRAIRDEVEASFASTGEAKVGDTPISVGIRFSGVRNSLYWHISSIPVVAAEIERRRSAPEDPAPSANGMR